MSHVSKTVLIVATVLCVGGAAIIFGAFAAAGFSFKALSTVPDDWRQTTRTFEAAEAIDSIVVQDVTGYVRIEQALGDVVQVEYWESDYEGKSYECAQEGNSLVLTGVQGTSSSLPVELFRTGFGETSTVVKVPRDWGGTLELETENGSLSVVGVHGLASLHMLSDAGWCSVENTSAGEVSLETTSGSLDLNGVEAAGMLAVKSSVGHVALEDVSADELSAQQSVGGLDVTNVRARTARLNSTDGWINAQSLAADDVEVVSENGIVDLLFAGSSADYVVDVQSDTGVVDAPRGANDAAKKVFVRTAAGSITLTFDGDGHTGATASAA